MTELTREQRDRVINTAHEVAHKVKVFVEPMTMEFGPTETILGLMLACEHMETFFKWSFPNGEEGLRVMHSLARDLNKVDMALYERELKASPLGARIKAVMEEVGIKDKL